MSDLLYSTVKSAFRLGPSQQINIGGTVKGYVEVSPKVVPRFNQPIKTHQMWASILWAFETTNKNISVNHSNLMVFDPFQLILNPDGFSASYVDLTVSAGALVPYMIGDKVDTLYTPGGSPGENMTLYGSDPQGLWEGFSAPFPFGAEDISISVPGLESSQSLVESYGDWHVTTVLGNASDPISDGNYLRITLMQGSPYIYCEKKGLSNYINIQTVSDAKLWYENQNVAVFTLPNDNQTYALFAPPGSYFTYTFIDSVNRLLSGSLTLVFSNNSDPQFFSVAVLPYQLIGNLVYARPEVGETNNLQSDGLALFDIPYYIVGTKKPSVTANLVDMFFGQYGGIINGVLSSDVHFPPNKSGSDFYQKLYNFTAPSSSDYPLFQAIQQFEQYAFAFPVDTRISWDYDQSDAKVHATYTVTTSLKYSGPGVTVTNYSSDTLIALKPHHYKYLVDSDVLLGGNYVYTSVRGPLRIMAGLSFETVYDYTGFVPSFPDVFSASDIAQLVSYFGLISDSFVAGNPALENPPAAVNAAQGTYATGKVLGRFAQMMPALTMTGQSDLRAEIIGYMRAVLTEWFTPSNELSDREPTIKSGQYNDSIQGAESSISSNARYFYYDQTWNTLIGYPADFNAGIELNDHHFHYGYFIHSMAYILLYGSPSDQAWALSCKPIIDMMIKDCANWDRSDSMFPFLRFFNAFNGHFLANGWGFGTGNQESTPEAMNFAAGTLLWGYLTGDDDIKNLGIFLYTSQKITLQEYWFDINQTNFPKNLFYLDTVENTFDLYDYNREIVCDLYSNAGDFSTFFGAEPVLIYGIQYLPITHASVYLGLMPQKLAAIDADLVPATQNFLNQGIVVDSNTNTVNFSGNYKIWDYADIFVEVRALYNPQKAVSDLAAMGLYQTELVIPANYNSDYPASPVPPFLCPAVSPAFGDTPLGEAGESKAHTYYWVHALKKLGPVQPDFVANIEMAVAFGYTRGQPDNFLVYQYVPSARIVTFRNLSSGARYCFELSGEQQLHWFTPSDSLANCTVVCPIAELQSSITIQSGEVVTLGNFALSDAVYLWIEGSDFLGSASDFPVQVKPSHTTQYTVKVRSRTLSDCLTFSSTTVIVEKPSVKIRNLLYPQSVCFSNPIVIHFSVMENHISTGQVSYVVSGGHLSDLVGTSVPGVTISFSDYAPSVATTLNYTITVYASDVSDTANFQVMVQPCLCSLEIQGLTYPATVRRNDPIDISFFVSSSNANNHQIVYSISNGGSPFSRQSARNIPISFNDTAPSLPTVLNYSVFACLSDRMSCSDEVNFQVIVSDGVLPSVKIVGVTSPITICTNNILTVNFMMVAENIGANQIVYVISGGGAPAISGQSKANNPLKFMRQVPANATTLNYSINAYVLGFPECSDQVDFHVVVQNCSQKPSITNTSHQPTVFSIFLWLFLFAHVYVISVIFLFFL